MAMEGVPCWQKLSCLETACIRLTSTPSSYGYRSSGKHLNHSYPLLGVRMGLEEAVLFSHCILTLQAGPFSHCTSPQCLRNHCQIQRLHHLPCMHQHSSLPHKMLTCLNLYGNVSCVCTAHVNPSYRSTATRTAQKQLVPCHGIVP